MMNLKSTFFSNLLILFTLLFISNLSVAQLKTPQPSPAASVMQTVGITEIDISYSSPGVKGREVWGGLLKNGKIWRSGANASTKITFSTDVSIDGTPVAAGTYSFFSIPDAEEWTIILNKNENANENSYKQEEDVVRVKVKAEEAPMKERLAYYIEQVSEDEARVSLHWEKKMVSFTVDISTGDMVMKGIKDEIAKADRHYITLAQSAQYALNGAGDEKTAFEWIEKSMSIKQTFYNTMVKSRMLAHVGKKEEAIETAKEAIKLGDANPTNAYTNFWKDSIEKNLKNWAEK